MRFKFRFRLSIVAAVLCLPLVVAAQSKHVKDLGVGKLLVASRGFPDPSPARGRRENPASPVGDDIVSLHIFFITDGFSILLLQRRQDSVVRVTADVAASGGARHSV